MDEEETREDLAVTICDGFVDNRAIVSTYNDSQIHPFPIHPTTTAISAACGMGKTQALIAHIKSPFGRHRCFILITHRKSLSRQMCTDLHNAGVRVTHYALVKGALEPRVAEVLVVQLEALPRITLAGAPLAQTTLVIDEYCSIGCQLVSANDLRTVHAFKAIMANSERCIVLDAYLDWEQVLSVSLYRNNDVVFWSRNTFQRGTAEDHAFTLAYGRQGMINEVVLRVTRSQTLLAPCSSKETAYVVEDIISNRFPEYRTLVYTAETDQDLKDTHFANVNENWPQYDLILFTSTLEVGVSCTRPHFDAVVALFDARYITVEQCLQMLFRSRPTRRFVVFVDSGDAARTPDALKTSVIPSTTLQETIWRIEESGNRQNQHVEPLWDEFVWSHDLLTKTLSKSSYTVTYANVQRHRDLSRRYFFPLLQRYLEIYGGTVRFNAQRTPVTAETVLATQRVKRMLAKAITDAPDIDACEAARLEHDKPRTPEEKYMLQKYHIGRDYRKPPERIDEDFVLEYGREHQRQTFCNCARLQDALDALPPETPNRLQQAIAVLNRQSIQMSLSNMHAVHSAIATAPGPAVSMADAYLINKYNTDVGHHELTHNALQFMLKDPTFTAATFGRPISTISIAEAIGAKRVTVTMKKRTRVALRTSKRSKAYEFREIAFKCLGNSFLRRQQFRYTVPVHTKQYLDVQDVITFVKCLLYHVYGTRLLIQTEYLDHEGTDITVYTMQCHTAIANRAVTASTWGIPPTLDHDPAPPQKRRRIVRIVPISSYSDTDGSSSSGSSGESQRTSLNSAWARHYIIHSYCAMATTTAQCACGRRCMTVFDRLNITDYHLVGTDPDGREFSFVCEDTPSARRAGAEQVARNGRFPIVLDPEHVVAMLKPYYHGVPHKHALFLHNITDPAAYGTDWQCKRCVSRAQNARQQTQK